MLRKPFSFRLILEGGALTPERVGAFLEAGCDDVLFSERQGVKTADFDRVAPSFAQAVLTAVHDIEVEHDLSVVRVEPDELVTMSGIADRTGRSRQNIAQLVSGQRGEGRFPPPLSTADGKTRIWRWTEVRDWFTTHTNEKPPADHQAHFVAALNGALEVRRHLKLFQQGGGPPRVARAVEAMALGNGTEVAADELRGSADDESSSGMQPLVSDGDDDDLRFTAVVRRAQSHMVFLNSSLLVDLSSSMRSEHAEVVEWLNAAASAHHRSLGLRLAGHLTEARPLDDVVFDNTLRILVAIEGRRGVQVIKKRRFARQPDVRYALTSRGEYVPLGYATWHSARSCTPISHMLAQRRFEPPDVPALLDAVEACQARDSARFPTLLATESGVVGPTTDATTRERSEHPAGELRQASIQDLYFTSWMLAVAARALTQRHLPHQIHTADDVVMRIADDLAVNFNPL